MTHNTNSNLLALKLVQYNSLKIIKVALTCNPNVNMHLDFLTPGI